ncbi:MAG TPA: hypothetical protein VF843_00295 [Streptosporangiaceae bacterium]
MTYLATSQGLFDQPGTVAFLVIFGMGVILFFVFRSMAKHLRKVNLAARAQAEAAAKAAAGDGGQPADGGDQAGSAAAAEPSSRP